MTNKPPPTTAALRRPIAARSPSSHPTGHGWTAALVLALGLAAPTQGQAGPLTYSFTDGQISGSLDGVAFAAASYTITATGDSAGVVSGNAGGTLPYYLQAVTTTIAIWARPVAAEAAPTASLRDFHGKAAAPATRAML